VSAQRLENDGSGRAVLVKAAGPGPDGERLRREAVLLRAAAHPGVVELLDERAGAGGGVELVLAVAGSRTLADVRTDLRGVVDLVAALAATVADLHALGLVHGRLTADHVVIDASGRPLLCGFADAGPALPSRRPADDVAALGVLLAVLVEPSGGGDDAQWEPIPERRLRRTDRWHGYAKRALLTVVDHATADDPARRPSARAFAAAVSAARPDERRRRPDPRDLVARARRAAVPLAAAVGLGLLVFGAGTLLRPAGEPDPVDVIDDERGDQAVPAAAAPSTSTTTSTTATSTTATPTTATTGGDGGFQALDCHEVSGPAADPDGDGCPSPVRLGDGVVEVDGVRYGVGRPGDLLAVGDWDCDGEATVALVHAGSGEVFVFEGWATDAAAAEATSTATVPSASAVEVADADGDGCTTLVVVDGDGARTEVVT
jgi:hypothetical protein